MDTHTHEHDIISISSLTKTESTLKEQILIRTSAGAEM